MITHRRAHSREPVPGLVHWLGGVGVAAAVLAAACSGGQAPSPPGDGGQAGAASDASPLQGGEELAIGGRFSNAAEWFYGSYTYSGTIPTDIIGVTTYVITPGLWSGDDLGVSDERRAFDRVLEFLDDNGEVIESVTFNAAFNIVDPVVESGPDGYVVHKTRKFNNWSLAVVARPAYSSYRISDVFGGRTVEVVEVKASAHAPVVEVLSPSEGQHFAGDTVTLQWRASDADGDNLHPTIYYSTDAGNTYSLVRALGRPFRGRSRADTGWFSNSIRIHTNTRENRYYPKATGYTGDNTEYTDVWDRWELQLTCEARFLVVVSDGVRWSTAESEIFSKAPQPC